MIIGKRPIVLVVSVALTVALGVLTVPRPPRLSEQTAGDQDLINAVRAQLGDSVRDKVSVAVIDESSTRTAHFGAGPQTRYEIGSVVKTMTGSLLAIGIESGEVTEDTRLGDLLDVGDGPVADITLHELATQSSGLPPLPTDGRFIAYSMFANLRGKDPYPVIERADLERQALAVEVGEKSYRYSNLGLALLGESLAAAAGTDYRTLVRERLLEPIGMPQTWPGGYRDLPTGFTASGQRAGNWAMSGYDGAGGLRAPLPDMINYVSAQLDGSAPGVAATEPIAPAGKRKEEGEIGYGWHTTPDGVTWHNGMTGGFASFVGFDRENGRGVVVLSNTAVSVDELGINLLRGES